jgi:hypothetical protein
LVLVVFGPAEPPELLFWVVLELEPLLLPELFEVLALVLFELQLVIELFVVVFGAPEPPELLFWVVLEFEPLLVAELFGVLVLPPLFVLF